MNATTRTLIVDASDESRELLASLLKRRGIGVGCVGSVEAAIEMLNPENLSAQAGALCGVVVLDSDQPAVGLAELAERAGRIGAPIVVVGTNRPHSPPLAGASFVRKPYHYAELVRRIEGALAGASGGSLRRAA